jgi:hypothetical protein
MRAALITDVSAPDAGGVLMRNARSAGAYLVSCQERSCSG